MMGKKRSTDVSDEEIIAIFSEAKTAAETARRAGIGQTTVFRILERHGVPRLSIDQARDLRALFTKDRAAEIRGKYEKGASFADLIGEYGGTFHSIKRAIRSVGGTLKPITPALTENEREKILELYGAGVSQMRISLEIGRSQSSIARFLRANGYHDRRRRGELHSQWKGGRCLDSQGYWRVRIEDDDPLAVMKLNDGYVAEHRLVMARKLGRPLKRHETVHHIDGNRENNAPENLQLRQGKHGKHIAMICLDCGSHNVAAAPLD